MCKSSYYIIIIITIVITGSCTTSRHNLLPDTVEQKMGENTAISADAVNINTATLEELVKIPHIGAKTAAKIIEHREKFGRFRKPEHLLLIDRISDARFREMRSLIKTERR